LDAVADNLSGTPESMLCAVDNTPESILHVLCGTFWHTPAVTPCAAGSIVAGTLLYLLFCSPL
jgi:hypothetical protein